MLKIGMVGADSNHSLSFSRALNVDKIVRGARVTHLVGETSARRTRTVATDGNIPHIAARPEDLGRGGRRRGDRPSPSPISPASRPTVAGSRGCRSISTNRSAAALPRPSASWRGPQRWGCPSVRLESSPCSPHLWRCKNGYPNWARSTQWSPPAPAMSSASGAAFSFMGSTKWKWFCGCSAMQ